MKLTPQTKTVHPEKVNLPTGNTPLVSPVHHSVKYTPRDVAHLRQILADRSEGFLYSRVSNPTVRELELLLASLQGRDDALCVASGVAAIATAVQGLIKAGDHLVMFRESYKPTRFLLTHLLGKFGVRTTILGLDDFDQLKSLLESEPVKALLLESPTNPMVRIPDLKKLTGLCRAHKTLTILDNTFAGFLHHGDQDIDLFVHSLTKHAGGHSDAMGGAIIGSKELIDQIAPTVITLGPTLDPNAAWLILRGMKTYDLRTKTASANAREIASWLESRRGIKRLLYPGLTSHPDHTIWMRQMRGDGGSVISFDIDGSLGVTDKFIDHLNLFSLTPSLGCVESLVAPCLCLFADDLTASEAQSAGIGPSTVRLAIGIESPSDLIADLDQALRHCGF